MAARRLDDGDGGQRAELDPVARLEGLLAVRLEPGVIQLGAVRAAEVAEREEASATGDPRVPARNGVVLGQVDSGMDAAGRVGATEQRLAIEERDLRCPLPDGDLEHQLGDADSDAARFERRRRGRSSRRDRRGRRGSGSQRRSAAVGGWNRGGSGDLFRGWARRGGD